MLDAMIETCICPFAAVMSGGHHVGCRVHSNDATNEARSADPWKIGCYRPRYICLSPYLGGLFNQQMLASTPTAIHAPSLIFTCQGGQAATPHVCRGSSPIERYRAVAAVVVELRHVVSYDLVLV